MIIAALWIANVVVADVPADMRVLVSSAPNGVVVLDHQAGGKRHVVLVRQSGAEELDVHDDACGEGADAKKAHEALYAELKKRDLGSIGVFCTSLPNAMKASEMGALRASTSAADGGKKTRTVSIDGIPIFAHKDDADSTITTFLLHGSGGRIILDWVDAGAASTFKIGALMPGRENNNVDVKALSAIGVADPCGVSVATNIPLEDTVAVTVAYALKSKVAITEAKTTREKSIVYASDKCVDVATKIAAKVPGGASVDKLTWKPAGNAGVVVALGETATP